jgi:hypothetical protein
MKDRIEGDKEGDVEGQLDEQEYRVMSGKERRQRMRIHDRLYQISIGLNFLAWLALIVALGIFHYARPEMDTGLLRYIGIEIREYWSEHHVELLNAFLQMALVMTLFSLILNQRRSRRETDRFAINLFVLSGIIVVSLLTLQITLL